MNWQKNNAENVYILVGVYNIKTHRFWTLKEALYILWLFQINVHITSLITLQN